MLLDKQFVKTEHFHLQELFEEDMLLFVKEQQGEK